jgi:aryl-alcohol dehydrogenase-like predicted oxidoreductase
MIPSMPIDGLGLVTSRIGLGCGRLVGGSTMRRSQAMIDEALRLGIRYFDVAPSYGMGTAEDVVGSVIGDSQDAVVATKVGPPRGHYSTRSNLLRRYVKPALDRLPMIKSLLRQHVTAPPLTREQRPRYDFSADRIRRSVNESLDRLKRRRVDVLLLHEPHPDDLTPPLEESMNKLGDDGQIGEWGVGIDAQSTPWNLCGSVWQSGWRPNRAGYIGVRRFVFHGVLRYAERDSRGMLLHKPQELIAAALQAEPKALLLVSASTPARLRELVQGL